VGVGRYRSCRIRVLHRSSRGRVSRRGRTDGSVHPVEGVTNATASYEKGTAEITYDSAKTSPDAIAKAVTEKSGFKADSAS
jgi:copper chaperone CopZ